MPKILGLDPSLDKAGYVVLDTDQPDSIVIEKGLLKTSHNDGIIVQRLMLQADRLSSLLKKYDISFVGMEAPFFGSGSTELLFALNQFIHRVFYENDTFIVCFPPQMLKKLVWPELKVNVVHKPHMVHKAKEMLGLQGKKLSNDVADAYWAGYYGKRFYKFYIDKTLKETDLGEYERGAFCGTHTFIRGTKAGVTDYDGIMYRENELFFNFKEIKRRTAECRQKENTQKEKQ